MMYHVTPTRNAESIRACGILTAYATGRRPAVWLVTYAMLAWGIMHVADRHGVSVDDVCVIEVRLRPADLAKTHLPGVYYTVTDVLPPTLGEIIPLSDD